MDVYAPFDAMKKTGGLQQAGQPAGEPAGTEANQQQAGSPGTNATGVVTPPAVGQPQEQQIQYDADGNPVDGDDLPF